MIEAQALGKGEIRRAIAALPVLEAEDHIRQMRKQPLAEARGCELVMEIIGLGHGLKLMTKPLSGKARKRAGIAKEATLSNCVPRPIRDSMRPMKTRMAGLRGEHSGLVMKITLLKRKLMRLDREWVRFRAAALIRDHRGGHEPSLWCTLLRSCPLLVLGAGAAVLPFVPHQSSREVPFLILGGAGMVLICVGLSRFLHGVGKASRFHRIRRRYQSKRRELVALIRHEQRRGI